MKILVPTDFSDFAAYAIDMATQIAHKMGAEIHLYNCAEIDDFNDIILNDRHYQDKLHGAIISWTREKLKESAEEIELQGIKCVTHLNTGKLQKNIETLVDRIGFDLVVMGSHGASGKEEWLIGSNAQKVIRQLRNNVLIVKDQPETLDFSRALFVSNLNLEDQDAFRVFLKFLSAFEIEALHILCVNTESYFSQPALLIEETLETFKKIATGFNTSTHFYSEYSIDAGVRHFSEEHDIKLIAISNHKRHPIKRIFQGSNVEMIVNHSKVPVLSLDYKN